MSVLKVQRLIALDPTTTDVTISGIVYGVPKNVAMSQVLTPAGGELVRHDYCSKQDLNCDSAANYIAYANGGAAIQSLESSSALAAAYLPVSLDPAIFRSLNNTFHPDYIYALFAYNQVSLVLVEIEILGLIRGFYLQGVYQVNRSPPRICLRLSLKLLRRSHSQITCNTSMLLA